MREVQYLEAKATYRLETMLDYDTENASVIFSLDVQ
jgi:hypothetical protein